MESDNSAQEDKSARAFDALLDAQLEGGHNSTVEPGEEFASALAVGERIAAGQAIVPSPDFAQTLKARFLEVAERTQSDQSAAAPVAPPPTNPIRPSRLVGARYVRDVLRSRRVQVATLAATLLIAMGTGLLLAAMSAPPASPL
jgi:hypothetical protein